MYHRLIRFIRTAEVREPPGARTLASQAHGNQAGSYVPDDFPDHVPYRAAYMDIGPIDHAGEYDTKVRLRCDCGAARQSRVKQCPRCGDTKPPERR